MKEFGRSLFDSLVNADALGRSYVVEKDKQLSRKKRVASAKYLVGRYSVSASGLHWFAAQDGVNVSFNLVPREALEYLKRKAFWISGITNQDILDAVHESLQKALRDGTSYRDFAESASTVIDALGVNASSSFRLDTVFRTNLFGAYSVAQLEQVKQVEDRFPLWEYVAILDDRTRDSHRALNGKRFKTGEGPIPPIDFNCRCTPRYLHIFEVEEGNLNADEVQLSGDLVKIDLQEEFERWLRERSAGMDPEIRGAVESNL